MFDRSYYDSFLLLVYFLTVHTAEKGKELIRMPKSWVTQYVESTSATLFAQFL